jgi:hypothetical protein
MVEYLGLLVLPHFLFDSIAGTYKECASTEVTDTVAPSRNVLSRPTVSKVWDKAPYPRVL